jgi:hypothetical protein
LFDPVKDATGVFGIPEHGGGGVNAKRIAGLFELTVVVLLPHRFEPSAPTDREPFVVEAAIVLTDTYGLV